MGFVEKYGLNLNRLQNSTQIFLFKNSFQLVSVSRKSAITGFAVYGCALHMDFPSSLYLVFVISRCPNIKSIDIGANNELTDESMIKIILQNPLQLLEEFHCERNTHFREFYFDNFLIILSVGFTQLKILQCL